MSASEKLKELDADVTGPQTYGPEPLEREEAAEAVMNALPQIVAVVEAAEQLPELYKTEDGRTHSFVPLLAALDEALS